MLKKYEEANIQLATEFIKKFYKEVYNEEATEYDIDGALDLFLGSYDKYGFKMLELNDMYFDINDVYIALKNDISMVVFENWYNDKLEANWTDKIISNLYKYNRQSKLSAKEIEKEVDEDLKQSKASVENAKQELEDIINKQKCDLCWIGDEFNWTRCKDCPPYNPNPRHTGIF